MLEPEIHQMYSIILLFLFLTSLPDFCIVSVEKAFLDSEGDFDICINCAAETRYGQSEQVVKSDLGFHSSLLKHLTQILTLFEVAGLKASD